MVRVHPVRFPAGEQRPGKGQTRRKNGERKQDRQTTAFGHAFLTAEAFGRKEQTMQGKQLDWFEYVLDSKRAELEHDLRHELRQRRQIASERRCDAVDSVADSAQREISIYELENKSRLLGKVREALGRIAVGAYGTCVYCGERIAEQRLKAVPWTRSCIGCQEHLERQGFEAFDESARHAV
jgi:DnaK suppressor protein